MQTPYLMHAYFLGMGSEYYELQTGYKNLLKERTELYYISVPQDKINDNINFRNEMILWY